MRSLIFVQGGKDNVWKNDYSGIYKIENLVNGKIYIGQSKQIRQRWTEHKKELRHNRHRNEYLQRAWNKYGEENFKHEVLELCPEEDLDDMECYYIKLYDSFNNSKGYNLTSGGKRRKEYSASTREKLRINGTGSNNPNSKKVICLETKKIYESMAQAGEDYNIDYTNIYRCCNLMRYTTAGVHWMFLDNYNNASEKYINSLLSKKDSGKTTSVIYLNTMEVFDSIKEASLHTGINLNSISLCCSHKRPRAGKTDEGEPRIFMYYDEYLKNQETV